MYYFHNNRPWDQRAADDRLEEETSQVDGLNLSVSPVSCMGCLRRSNSKTTPWNVTGATPVYSNWDSSSGPQTPKEGARQHAAFLQLMTGLSEEMDWHIQMLLFIKPPLHQTSNTWFVSQWSPPSSCKRRSRSAPPQKASFYGVAGQDLRCEQVGREQECPS